MLVLSRKIGQRILIGPNIEIVIVDHDRDRVKVGIDAPRSVPILRGELAPYVVGAIEQRAEANRPYADGGAE